MRTISQNPNENQTGKSLWTLEDVLTAQAKQKAQALEIEQREGHPRDEEDDYWEGDIDEEMLVDLDL
jgi:DNA excision repair protein ERCC-2